MLNESRKYSYYNERLYSKMKEFDGDDCVYNIFIMFQKGDSI